MTIPLFMFVNNLGLIVYSVLGEMTVQIQQESTEKMAKKVQPELVSRSEFLRLLTSHQALIRRDDRPNRRRGLVDASGRWFVIDESDLAGPSGSNAVSRPAAEFFLS